MREISQEARYRQMMEEPVHTLIPRLAVPSIISMLVTAIYNMADTYFVSQLGTSPSAAVGVVFSLMAGIQAVAFMIGMGGGGRRARRQGPERGADLRYDLEISFEEAAFGKEVELSIPREENCPTCGGSGAAKGSGAGARPGGFGGAVFLEKVTQKAVKFL